MRNSKKMHSEFTLSVLVIIFLPALMILTRAASDTLALVGDLDQQELVREAESIRRRFELDLPRPAALDRPRKWRPPPQRRFQSV